MSAVFSPCGLYRYRLDRAVSMLSDRVVAFCLHNPSTAAADSDDPTSRRGIGYATAWGAGRLVYVNPWAGIATKPRFLWAMDDPVGPENDRHILDVAREVAATDGVFVLAWGAISPPAARRADARARLRHVEALIRSECEAICALGVNADGSPKHPLYVRADAQPLRWPETWRTAA